MPRQHSGRRGLMQNPPLRSGGPMDGIARTSQGRSGSERHESHSSSGASSPDTGLQLMSPKDLEKVRRLVSHWQAPLDKMRVTSDFGRRNGDFHEGVDLKAGIGTPVYAVDRGKVIYAGNRISGYGKMVVIKHASGLASIYAHNSKLFVRAGESVLQGNRIALSGNTGKSSGPHVHFEVRKGTLALNPMMVLPARGRLAIQPGQGVPKRTRRVASR
ncbi:MAG: M23 family metallopeptidase [Bdellovibrionales bacterium]|nr:M23 family metallopeptidase [Bdellovibrionales bacterium]